MLNSLITSLAHFFAPWQKLYSESKVLETGVTAGHIVATLVGGGIAIAADRDTLRTLHNEARLGPPALDELHATHRPVIIGLAVLFITGVALAAADVDTFAHSPIFILKLVLVLLLCVNGALLTRAEHCLRRRVMGEDCHPESPDPTDLLWNRLRRSSWLSIFLWITTTIVGAALANA